MPLPGPLHERLAPLCTSLRWKEWAGYHAVRCFGHTHEPEYMALRQAAGLLDVSPLFKVRLRGPDAARALSRVMVRDISKLRQGRVVYSCWCDDAGKVIDDGTVARLPDDTYRVTSAEPSLGWLTESAAGLDVDLEEETERLAALALQGPRSREVLRGCAALDVDALGFFGVAEARVGGVAGWVSRTGYTGDLGYEIWVDRRQAVTVWDSVIEAGRPHGTRPVGLDALDMTRIEAGFILQGVDYHGARQVVLESRKSTPFEIGLGWLVQLDRGPFVGRDALRREAERGPAWRLVGLVADWEEIEALYESHGLPPALPPAASRDPLPVYDGDRQVGRATSHAWSPLLKKSLALASVRSSHAEPGTVLRLEHTVEFERATVRAIVVELPFFDPERKRRP